MNLKTDKTLEQFLIQQLKADDLAHFKIGVEKLDLMQMMRGSVVEVVFEKKDGTTRFMECTHVAALMTNDGQRMRYEKINGSSHNPLLLAAYDLEKEEWRALRPLSVYMYRKPGKMPVMTMKLKQLYENDPSAALNVIDSCVGKFGINIKRSPEMERSNKDESLTPTL